MLHQLPARQLDKLSLCTFVCCVRITIADGPELWVTQHRNITSQLLCLFRWSGHMSYLFSSHSVSTTRKEISSRTRICSSQLTTATATAAAAAAAAAAALNNDGAAVTCSTAPPPSLFPSLPTGVGVNGSDWQTACRTTTQGANCSAQACSGGVGRLNATCSGNGTWVNGSSTCVINTCRTASPPQRTGRW
jgi:hypothetical protein